MPLEPRAVGTGRGASWWGEAWRLFTPAVGVWLLTALLIIVITLVGALIPAVGWLAIHVLSPVFMGGLMLGCRALDRGNPLALGHLFAGFSQSTGPLVVLGLIFTGLMLLITLIVVGMMIAVFGVAIFQMLTGSIDASQTGVAFGSVVVAVLLGFLFLLLLLLPLVMAVWFAPALVMLGGLSPGDGNESVVPRLLAQLRAVPGLRGDRPPAGDPRVDSVLPGVVRAGPGHGRNRVRVLLRHLRRPGHRVAARLPAA